MECFLFRAPLNGFVVDMKQVVELIVMRTTYAAALKRRAFLC